MPCATHFRQQLFEEFQQQLTTVVQRPRLDKTPAPQPDFDGFEDDFDVLSEALTAVNSVSSVNCSDVVLLPDAKPAMSDSAANIFYQKFPCEAGTSYGRGETAWQKQYIKTLEGDSPQWGGFADQDEWELAQWIMKSGLSQGELNNFLKLKMVSMLGKVSPCMIINFFSNSDM
jgi:hypothetical protein